MFGFFKKRDRIADFWDWFSSNLQFIRYYKTNPDKVLGELNERLHSINKNIFAELATEKDGSSTLNVTAMSNPDFFSIVVEVVKKAPKIEGWNIVPFRQRFPLEHLAGMSMKMGDFVIKADGLWVLPLIDEKENLFLEVYSDGFPEEPTPELVNGVLILMDHVLGERDAIEQVVMYELVKMTPEMKSSGDLISLLELPELIDYRKGEK